MDKNVFEEPSLAVYQLTEEDALETNMTSAQDWGAGAFEIESV